MVLTEKRKKHLYGVLERVYHLYNRKECIDSDPLSFLYRYDDVRDREIAGLIASSLAFGGITQIYRSIERVLKAMGTSPAAFLRKRSPAEIKSSFSNFQHRWITGDELASMLIGVKGVTGRHGSLEACFYEGQSKRDDDVIPALTLFVNEIVCGQHESGICLLPSPCKKSACKRLNLFLRWMVRRDGVDPGCWTGVSPSKLVVPLDIHIFRLSKAMGLTRRSGADLKTAREVTSVFREIIPADPVKYDFSLTRLAIGRDRDRGVLLEGLGIHRDAVL